MHRTVFVGWDPREAAAFAVARRTIQQNAGDEVQVFGLVLDELVAMGLYSRPTEQSDGKLIDVLSRRDDYDGAMSTEHACARFLAYHVAQNHLRRPGWVMFVDGDIMVRSDLDALFASLDPLKALYCVKHDYRPDATTKMDGQTQTRYHRKNWSSVMIFNTMHLSNAKLTVDMINTLPGRELHAFSWLNDDEIGELDPAWNWLVGHSDPKIEPKLVHFTAGCPDMTGYEDVDFAQEWRSQRQAWAVKG